jgi:hypothetical protein
MEQGVLRNRWHWAYAGTSAVFWLAAWIIWDGTGRSGSSSVHLGWQGAVLNGLMLIPLFKRFEWARWVLIVEATATIAFIGSLGVPPFGPAFGSLAFLALLQLALLVRPQVPRIRRSPFAAR